MPNNNFVDDYELELLSDTTLTFEGIRLGDVSGNWSAPFGKREDEELSLELPETFIINSDNIGYLFSKNISHIKM